jgi:hypothetical protein
MTTDKSSTVSGPLLPEPLVGESVRLWPYAPGCYGKDALYRVWKAIEDDGAMAHAFWDDPAGELGSFVRAFDGVAGKLLVMVEHVKDQQLGGLIWLTNLVVGHQAFVSMWMRKDYRGPVALEAAKLFLPPIFALYDLQQMWAVTPWAKAGAMCQRVGFKRWCLLPGYCQWEGQPKDVQLYRLKREQILG